MHLRSLSVLAAGAVVLVVAGWLGATAQAAPRDFGLERLASVAPNTFGDGVSDIAIDSTTQRAFVLDQKNKAVQVYDISESSFEFVTTISDGAFTYPVAAAVNQVTHKLYVADAGNDTIVTADVDPQSATANRVTSRVASGGTFAGAVAVDEKNNRVFVANRTSGNVSVLDGSGVAAPRMVAVGVQPNGVVVDPDSGKAYVPSQPDSSITVLNTDGSTTLWPLENRPDLLAIGGGSLFITTDRPSAEHVEKFSLQTMSLTATSRPLGSMPNGIAVDSAFHTVYATDSGEGIGGVSTLRSTDLSIEDAGPNDYFNSVIVDPKTHRILVGETPRSWRPSEVVMFQPNPRPLPSVDRVSGADRFEVSANVAGETFASGVPVVYVAAGGGFADALSGSAAAGAQHGPVLLVSKDSVPAAVAARLKSLRPQRIVILGGTASVSEAVEKALGDYTRSLSRLAGADRYEVSAAVSESAFPDGAQTVYLASGAVFSDALSTSAAAGLEGSPVLLTKKNEVPGAVLAEITRLKPSVIFVLGGTNTVDESVVTALQSTYGVVRIDGPDRYTVSAAVAARAFPQSVYTLYVASGAVFPDALSGSAAAIAEDAPVLLIQKDAIPAPVAAQLDRLNPYRIVVLGGPNTLSEAVQSQLETYLPQ
ncbi:cell wall-binding repeat-containing protein [Herbiconiux sp.]|uniref:cell wall-binding repeat-containing protein n=1 Tax=Herbiconiux sp. TaxID=1871186 RepID=UPI0025C34A60|nr:cell wall-binding repeat-containing protein [Herbiconiux sp.]